MNTIFIQLGLTYNLLCSSCPQNQNKNHSTNAISMEIENSCFTAVVQWDNEKKYNTTYNKKKNANIQNCFVKNAGF